MFKFLILLLLPLQAFADVIDWTRKGYFVVYGPDNEYINRHVSKEEAMATAANHAFNSGNTGELAYRIESPYYEVVIAVPEVAQVEPPLPPDPPVDTGDEIDPSNTFFACDKGERGVTVEPTGDDSNTGRMDEDGKVHPVKSLSQLVKLVESAPDGVDARLCEGAKFDDQTLPIRKSGDVGPWNAAIISTYEARALREVASQYPSAGEWVRKNNPELFDPEKIEYATPSTYRMVGFDKWAVDRVEFDCYKILNGIVRPCMNPYPFCEGDRRFKCIDPVSKRLRS